MCEKNKKLRFCSCGDTRKVKYGENGVVGKWYFHRYNPNKGIRVMGTIPVPEFPEILTGSSAVELLEKRLNEADSFDLDLKPKEQDRIHIYIKLEGNKSRKSHAFIYSDGKWEILSWADTNPFDLENEYDEEKRGLVEESENP